MVEQRPFKPLVGGSSPPAPTTSFPVYRGFNSAMKKHKAMPAPIQYLRLIFMSIQIMRAAWQNYGKRQGVCFHV